MNKKQRTEKIDGVDDREEEDEDIIKGRESVCV